MFTTKAFVDQYGMGDGAAIMTRFFGSIFVGSVLMAIYVGFVRAGGLENTWAFFNLIFLQNASAFVVGFWAHQKGNLGTTDVIKWAMSGDIKQDKTRVVYENDEVGIHHAFVTFDDGNIEAVMAVYKYKDGKIIALETGATPMPK